MKRKHSVEFIEQTIVANKRIAPEIVIDNDSSSSDSITTATSSNISGKNQESYNRQEVKELFTKLRSMFPQKSDVVINNTIQRNLNNLDINLLCNALIEDKSENKQDVIIINNRNKQHEQARPTTSSNASIEDDLDIILQIVPDCDPDYIKNELKVQSKHQNRGDIIVANLLERKNYPRLKDKLIVSKKENKLENYLNMEISIEDFLKIYPQPFDYFIKGITK